MEQGKLIKTVAVIVTSLAECENGSSREGIIYAGLMGHTTLDELMQAFGICETLGFIVRGSHHKVTITDEGRKMAEKIEAAMAK